MLMMNKCVGTCAYMGGVLSVAEDFCWSWSQMVQCNAEQLCEPGKYIHYDRAKTSYHAYARNSLVERMRGDWLLMLDTDHAFDPDLCIRMVNRMNTYNVDVLTGLYTYKAPPHAPLVFAEDGKGFFMPIAEWGKEATLLPCDSAGAGCLLVRRRVFDLIRDKLKCGPFDIDPPFSEDHSFFRRLKKVDVQAWFDPAIECHHLAVKRTGLADFDSKECGVSERIPVGGLA